ncbi:MAG TPA: hypothetical protein VF290_19560 [Pyrinomonadaceae bacterium]
MKRTQELLIIDVWKPMDKDVVGAPELESIQETIAERFGTSAGPASIARALADHGVRLGHPEILQADLRWRERNLLFTPEDLTFGTLAAANALIEKVETLRRQFENDAAMAERLRREVRQLKTELDLLAANEKAPPRELAQEVAQWLTIWLQTPLIFGEWVSLRRSTADFQSRFSS